MQPRYSMRLSDSFPSLLSHQAHLVKNLTEADRHHWPTLESMVHFEAFRLDNRRGHWVGILLIDNDQPMNVDSTLSRVLELYTERAVTEIERLGLEVRFQESEARYRAFFETAVQASMIVDRQARQSQWQLQTLGGSIRTMVVHSFRVSGNLTEGVMLSFDDISDRLSVEASLREQHQLMNRRQQRLRGLVDVATRLERQSSVRDFLVSSCAALTQKVGLSQVACFQPDSEFWYASNLRPEQRTHFQEHSEPLQQALATRHISWGTDTRQPVCCCLI